MASSTDKPKFFANDTANLRKVEDPDEELIKVLKRVVQKFPPNKKWSSPEGLDDGGLYAGPTGLAYVCHDIAHPHVPLIGFRTAN